MFKEKLAVIKPECITKVMLIDEYKPLKIVRRQIQGLFPSSVDDKQRNISF